MAASKAPHKPKGNAYIQQEEKTLKEDTKVSQALGCHFLARNTNVLVGSCRGKSRKGFDYFT